MPSRTPNDMSLYLKFNGPAVEGGRLEASELAPALIGLHGLAEVACQAVHGDGTKVRLDIKAELRQGSFITDFWLVAADGQLLEGLSIEDLVSPEHISRRTVSKTVLEIVSPVFREGQKWRFSQGDSVVIFAEILDQTFSERVGSGEIRFASGRFPGSGNGDRAYQVREQNRGNAPRSAGDRPHPYRQDPTGV